MLGGFVRTVFMQFERDKCLILASSVVYTTLISMVPFLTFVVAMLNAFGAFAAARITIEELVVNQFGNQTGSELMGFIEGFITNAGGLGAFGLISFLITSVILINRVWVIFNQIYRTSMGRGQLLRFARFVTVLVVGTLLLGAYFSVTSLLSDWFLSLVGSNLLTLWFYRFLAVAGPWILIWMALFMLIYAVPSTRVRVSSAILGSVIGTIAFQIANEVFSRVVLRVVNYSIIYGSLASVLIVLVWIYFLWVIILGAVEVAYVHQYRPDLKHSGGLTDAAAHQIPEGVNVLLLVADQYEQGKGAISERTIAARLRIPDGKLQNYLTLFEREEYIMHTDRAGKHYILSRPVSQIVLRDVVSLLYGIDDPAQLSGQVSVAGGQVSRMLFQKGIDGLPEHITDLLNSDS